MSKLLKLLIIDDSPRFRRAIKQVVNDLVSEIHEYSDGADALTAYAAHRPDWVLMDIRMKKIDGLSATRQIKKSYPDALIAIISIGKDEAIREAALLAGACAFIAKDNLFELRNLLIENLEKPTKPTGLQ
ncbi:MAG: response regulator transcription factor [Acidobacteriota bacterium]